MTVNPKTAVGGGPTPADFRAPNQEPSAKFTKLTILLSGRPAPRLLSTRPRTAGRPPPLQAKLAKPITTEDGTTTEYTTPHLDRNRWRVAPEQYQNFDVSVGPLPHNGTMTFTADQTYSDGTVVHWDEVTKAGAAEPEHPAPVLTLTAAATDTADTTDTTGGSPSSADGVARGLGIAGIVIGVAGVAVAAVAIRRRSGSA